MDWPGIEILDNIVFDICKTYKNVVYFSNTGVRIS